MDAEPPGPPPPPPTPSVPTWLLTAGGIAWRALPVVVLIWLAVLLLDRLTVVVVPILVALLLAGVLQPLVRRAPARWPSWLAPLLVTLTVAGIVMAAVAGLGLRLVEELPHLRQEFSDALSDSEQRFGVELPDLPQIGTSSPQQSQGPASGSSEGLVSGSAREIVHVGLEVLFGFFLTLALAFLFLKDGSRFWAWTLDKVGPSIRDDLDQSGRAAWGTVGIYVRGLTIVALFDAIGIGVGLLVLGVPLVATLAALQFVASYIPTIGAFVAGGVAVVVAFGTAGFSTAVLTAVLIVVVQQLGNDVIEPWVMGSTLPLHPAVILIVVGVGAVLWGVAGALLFVPLAAALSAAGHVLWVRRRSEVGRSAAHPER